MPLFRVTMPLKLKMNVLWKVGRYSNNWIPQSETCNFAGLFTSVTLMQQSAASRECRCNFHLRSILWTWNEPLRRCGMKNLSLQWTVCRKILYLVHSRPAHDMATDTEWQLPEVVLTQFVSPDDEHDVLEIWKELKIKKKNKHIEKNCASCWSFIKNHVCRNFI